MHENSQLIFELCEITLVGDPIVFKTLIFFQKMSSHKVLSLVALKYMYLHISIVLTTCRIFANALLNSGMNDCTAFLYRFLEWCSYTGKS